jgi:hypothetical protein
MSPEPLGKARVSGPYSIHAGSTTPPHRDHDSEARKLAPREFRAGACRSKIHAATQKITYLPRKLSTAGALAGTDPSVGDIAYYSP